MAITEDTFDGTNYQSARLQFDADHDDLSPEQALYGQILGGGGDDRIIGIGVDQRLFGEAGDDTLRGGQGAPELRGGFGNDQLTLRTANFGAVGHGGPDNDMFFLSVDRGSTTGEQDRITLDGGIGFDQLEFREFDGAILYVDVVGGQIGNDFNGPFFQEGIISGIEAFVVVNGLEVDANMAGSWAAEAFQGGRGDDTILGKRGPDTLIGGDGLDHLQGGNGADLIIDGRMPSTLDLDREDRAFVETLAGGNGDDTLISVAGMNQLSGDNGADYFILTGGADTVRGGEGDDHIVFSAAFNTPPNSDFTQTLFQIAPPDDPGDPIPIDRDDGALFGLSITGGPGLDWFDLSTLSQATGGYRIDLEAQGGRPTFAAFDVFDIKGIEHITGTAYGDTFVGADAPMRLEGMAGADTLFGGTVEDTLRGGADADEIRGRARADTLEGNQGNDLLMAGRGADSLIGGAGADTLRGGIGPDELRGGSVEARDSAPDVFLFMLGDGRDVILDFETDTALPDRLDLTGWTLGTRAALDFIEVTAGGLDPVTGTLAETTGVWVLPSGPDPALALDAVFLVDQTGAAITDAHLLL